MTCTPWYSARDYKPVRVGEYEAQFALDLGRALYCESCRDTPEPTE